MEELRRPRVVNGYHPGCIVDLGPRCANLMPGDTVILDGRKWEITEKLYSPFFGRTRFIIKPHRDTLI